MKQKLVAFHNSQKEKDAILLQLQKHYKADEIIKGKYWENGKGCAVGCTVHSSSHVQYEIQFGIPVWFAHLEDYLFENLSNKNAKEFPLLLFRAIPVGFHNWDALYHKFCVYILTEIIPKTNNKNASKVISTIIQLHKNEETDQKKWSAAWSAAESATGSAAWSAAESATGSAVRSAAWSAAGSAAGSATWSATRSATRSAAVKKISGKLVLLLEK